MEEQGDHRLCFNDARTFTESINGMEFFFSFYLFISLKEKETKKKKENLLPDHCSQVFPSVNLGNPAVKHDHEGRPQRVSKSHATSNGSERSGTTP